MKKKYWMFSTILRIILASSILFGHIVLALILLPLQNSITSKDTQEILVSGIDGVRKSLAIANSAVNAPEYAYLFTEYDSVGKGGGFIVADNLHDIRCGKRVEGCRTLEDAGIDINKYAPLKINEAEIFGVPCNFAYVREESFVIVAYIPASVQKSQRAVNVFAALGTSLIVFTLLFFLVPLLVRFLSRFSWFPPVSACGASETEASGIEASTADEAHSAADDENSSEADTDYSPADTDGSADDVEAADDADYSGAADEAVNDADSPDTDGLTEYVEKMRELKQTAYKLGEEKLFRMAAYLEKCGMAVLAGSKDSDKFMAEIENKTSVVMKYYASCVPQPEPEVAAENVPLTEEASAKAVQSEPKPVPEPEPEQEPEHKADVSPAEIFAVLEALYAGAATTDANAVNTQISALSRINLPPKLNAVFPELALAARQNDFLKIKAVIDSLRTRA